LLELAPDVARVRADQLQLTDPHANAVLERHVARLGEGRDAPAASAVPLPRAGSLAPMIMYLSPIPSDDRRAHARATLIVMVPAVRKDVPKAPVLQGLFNFTPAEARVARGIAQGRTIADIAAELGLSNETVRSQRKSALAKTGCARNIDLAVVLTSASLLPE